MTFLTRLFKKRKTKAEIDLLNDPIKTLVHETTYPLMLAGFVSSSYGFVDMLFASRLGSVEVASIAFVMPMFVLLQALTTGIIRGGVSIIATLLGKGERVEASAYATQLRLMVMLLSVLVTIPFVFLLPIILKLADVPDELYLQSQLYSQIMFLTIPFVLFSQLYKSFFRSQGLVKIISQVSIFSVVSNAVFNFVFLTFTSLEIKGLALASLVTLIAELAILVFVYKRSNQKFELAWWGSHGHSIIAIWQRLLKVGLPLSLSQASSHFGFVLLNILIVQFGHHAVAAFAIGNRINSLMFASSKQIGNGIVPLLAQNWGKGSIERVQQTIAYSLRYSVVIGVAAAVIIQLIKYPLARYLANDDLITYQHIINYVGLVGWSVIAWVLLHTYQAIFTSFQKTLFSMTIDIVRLWGIRIPGVLIFFYFVPSVAEYGIWYTMFISNTVTLLFAFVYYWKMIPGIIDQRQSELDQEQNVLKGALV